MKSVLLLSYSVNSKPRSTEFGTLPIHLSVRPQRVAIPRPLASLVLATAEKRQSRPLDFDLVAERRKFSLRKIASFLCSVIPSIVYITF